MYKGMYIAASGAVSKMKELELVSNNIANSNTYGYKLDRMGFKDFLLTELNDMEQPNDARDMTYHSGVYTDRSMGGLIHTGNQLDVAINGPGYFVLDGGRYTRNGNFKVNSEGFLVNDDGRLVQGTSGPIGIPNGDINISSDGNVSVNGVPIDKLQVVEFATPSSVYKQGDSTFASEEAPIESNSTVEQGHLETSNVNIVREMVNMIELYREYEAHQKVMQAFDEATSKVTNNMANL
ncbi:flagellar basal-body rod protein FlgF [Candidatus Magnetomonas plexicatena]|uniref:flagellar basal-body rod protein FlgF n=1 Tax=Candidatus Magnetomonas plexicatena TaxID=2552947 RepID=UPI001C74F442|nr:flagellar basal-body rod protein FlgF [Nitrospirales bacterium LBB_01]